MRTLHAQTCVCVCVKDVYQRPVVAHAETTLAMAAGRSLPLVSEQKKRGACDDDDVIGGRLKD